MSIITHKQISTKEKIKIIKIYRNKSSIKFITSRYGISKATLMRWNKLYDGNDSSLDNKSRRPKYHPNQHTKTEIDNVLKLIRRNPNIGLTELYSKLRHNYNYTRHYASLYRLLVRLDHFTKGKVVYKKYVPQKYHTPECLGEKMQLDVKYVPNDCKADLTDENKYYQYTIIDEASRERFIYPFREYSALTTVEFVKMAIAYFGYIPKIIQTDNGAEFTYPKESKHGSIHSFDKLCIELEIEHKLIRPRTPRHNGKVERSHRNDNDRFYRYLKFYCYDDLINQMARYLKRSNNIGMTPLGYKTPIEKRKELIREGKVYIKK